MGATPVPVNVMVWVPGEALSVITMLPVAAPRVAGVKVTVMSHLVPGATEVPQLSVSAKLPLATILAMLTAIVLLLLLSLTVLLALVDPTPTEPNESEVVERVTTWACAVSIDAASRMKKAIRTRDGMCK